MTTIALTRDAGPDTAVVPTVVGLTRTTAEARIRAAGFVARSTRPARLDAVVVRQRPRAGATIPRGAIVGITASAR